MSAAARRGLLVFLFGVLFLIGALAFDYLWLGSDNGASTVGVSIGGPFTLTDQNGTPRHDTDFRGKLMLVYFGYSYCPDACPTTLMLMSDVMDRLGAAADQVVPVFITVDPGRDSPQQLKLYATNFTPRLVALSGSEQATAAVARAYRVYYKKVDEGGPDNYVMDHTSFIYLMGRDGRYVTHFQPDATAEDIAAAIKRRL